MSAIALTDGEDPHAIPIVYGFASARGPKNQIADEQPTTDRNESAGIGKQPASFIAAIVGIDGAQTIRPFPGNMFATIGRSGRENQSAVSNTKQMDDSDRLALPDQVSGCRIEA